MHPSFLWRRADLVAVFNEASILQPAVSHQNNPYACTPFWRTHRLLLLRPPRVLQRIMILTNMQPQKMFRRKILPTLRTPMCMHFRVVYLEFFKRRERERLRVRWEGAFHYCFCRGRVGGLAVFRGVEGHVGGV